MMPAMRAAQLGEMRAGRRSNSRHVVSAPAMIGKPNNESRERATFFRRADEHVELGAVFHRPRSGILGA
jgi:hypothetical protein